MCRLKNCKLAYILLLFILTACRPSHDPPQRSTEAPGWSRLGPGGGGSTFIPTFSYFNPNEFILRCDMTGSYLTTDGGNSYRQINLLNGAGSFAFDPRDSNTLYIGGYSLLRSTDHGNSWDTLFPDSSTIKGATFSGDHASYKLISSDTGLYHPLGENIQAIGIDDNRPASIYFGMGPWFYYSGDAGKTWKQEKLSGTISLIYVATPRRNDKSDIFIFTPAAVYTFNPESQKLKSKALPAGFSPSFSFAAGKDKASGKTYFYALHQESGKEQLDEFGNTGVIRSVDEGDQWEQLTYPRITNRSNGNMPSYSMIACAKFDAKQVWLICNRYLEKKIKGGYSFWYGALKSMNGGDDWDWVWRGGGGSGQYGVKDGMVPENLKDAWVNNAFGGEYIRLMDVGVDPHDGQNAVITDWYRTMKTTDGGTHWTGIYSRENKGSAYNTVGLDVTTSYGVHVDPFNKNHVAISYTDIGYHHSFDGGKSWYRSVKGIPQEWVNTCYWAVFDPTVPGKIWTAWSGMHDLPRGKMTRNPNWKQMARGGVAFSTDSGKTWIPAIGTMSFDAPTTSLILDPRSPPGRRMLYATAFGKGVFKSSDDGKTWQLKNKGMDENLCAFELTLSPDGTLFLTVSPTPKFVEGKVSREFYSGAVYRSVNGAETWERLKVVEGAFFPNGMDVDPREPRRVYLSCWSTISLGDLVGGKFARESGGDSILKMPGGVFVSEDEGNSWKQSFDSLQYVYDITVDPFYPGTLYCNGFNGAAYRSVDKGKSWKRLLGYDFHWGHRVIPDPSNKGQVYLTTYGSSVWHGKPQTEK